jgi:RNA polymerase sigma-B factor
MDSAGTKQGGLLIDSRAGAATATAGGGTGLVKKRKEQQARGSTGYEHLAPLFGERAGLPADHPRRAVLRAQLITGYLPVAQHMARRHRHRGENLQDLEQVAALGLIHAVDRFDPDFGVDFLSYAVPTINGELLRHFRDRASTIRMPRRLRELQSLVYQTVDELGQQLGRSPRPSEIAQRLDLPVDIVIEGLQVYQDIRCSSLDEPAAASPAGDGRNRFDAALAHLDLALDLIEQREMLEPLLAALPPRERTILLLRFYGGQTQREIGKRVGISQMHVSRLLASTLAGLRRKLTTEQ